MKTNTRGSICYLTVYVLIFFVILLLSCTTTSTSLIRLEANDFEKNLPGLWEGKWVVQSFSGKQHINILKINGNKIDLTGFQEGVGSYPDTNEVNGRIENSTLLLTWPASSCDEKYTMQRDDSNILILDGRSECGAAPTAKVQLKKIE